MRTTTRINNVQLYSIAALYAKKFISEKIRTTSHEFVNENLDHTKHHALMIDAAMIALLASKVLDQFASEYDAAEFKAINREIIDFTKNF